MTALARLGDIPTALYESATVPEVQRVVDRVIAEHGPISGMACCVGSILLKPAHLISPDEFDETLRTNVGSAFAVVRAAATSMPDGGSVVLVSSAAGRLGLSNHEAIAAAKAAVSGLARSAAATYSGRGLRVNCVAPGLVQTPLTSRITSNERSAEFSRSMHAAGRLGEPGDVSSLIAWLLDPHHSWVTGQEFGVDGGLGTVRTSR